MLNGNRVESETGRVRRPLLADWLRRDAMPTLDSAHTRTCWRAREECHERQDGSGDGVGVVVVCVVIVGVVK